MNKYYLFISYSRADNKAAAYLQRQLEHFRIPVKQVPPELLPDGQKFLRPVFRDKRDLKTSEQNFTNDIKAALEESRYLLVLCSPNSADSIWVDAETKHFLAAHDDDCTKIVPVILEGRPGHGGNVECLPPALRRQEITSRNLPSMIPDDGEPVKAGWENGVVQALSYMLKVDREKIKASVDREKLRQAKIYAALGACAVLGLGAALIFAGLTVWALRAKHLAARNEKLATEYAELARQNELRARKNEKHARDNAELARQNEARATANEKRAVASEKLAKENEAEARKQADVARRSLEFLGVILSSSDPTQMGNKDMKVLDAIKGKLPEIPKLTPWQLRASVSRHITAILSTHGEYDAALLLARDALKLHEADDPQSLDTADCCNELGCIFESLGRYTEAVKCFQKALSIRSKHSDQKDSPDTAILYRNLGLVYCDQCKYDEALLYYRKALEINLKILGENHPNTAAVYNNLGMVHSHLGAYDWAAKYHKQALEINLKTLGENHPSTAVSYNNLGWSYWNLGDRAKAVECMTKAAAIAEKVLGKDHPTAKTMKLNLADMKGLMEK